MGLTESNFTVDDNSTVNNNSTVDNDSIIEKFYTRTEIFEEENYEVIYRATYESLPEVKPLEVKPPEVKPPEKKKGKKKKRHGGKYLQL